MSLVSKELPLWHRFAMSDTDIYDQMFKTPKAEKTVKAKQYTEVELEDWTWINFVQYWNHRYHKTLGILPPGLGKREMGRLKGTIEPSLEHWGNEIFRDMIDYVFDSVAYYPQWKNLTIGIICGNHYWVQEISRKVQESKAF